MQFQANSLRGVSFFETRQKLQTESDVRRSDTPKSSTVARMPRIKRRRANATSRAKRRCTNDLPNSPLLRKPRNTCSARICAPEIRPRRTDSRRGCFARVLCKNHPSKKLPLEKRSENGGQGKLLSKIRSAAGPSDAFLAHFSAFEFSDLRKRRQVSSLDATWAQLR